MYEFIRLQYLMGKLNAFQVQSFAPQWISEAEAAQIIGPDQAE